jgi:thioesterase domain-containing protein
MRKNGKGFVTMDSKEIEACIHEHIPLSKTMEVQVRSVSGDTVVLEAPIEPNINHRETVLGGSASALAILAAWCLLYTCLRGEGVGGRIVIRKNTMKYTKPIDGPFRAIAVAPKPSEWQRMVAMLMRGRMARMLVKATLECNEVQVGEFAGEFVVLVPRV